MPIVMRCPGCETQFEFANQLQGKRIKCKTCGDVFRVEIPGRIQERAIDERPAVRRRRDDKNDRPHRDRRPYRDDDDDRRDRRPPDDSDFPPARKRIHPLLIIGPIGAVAVIAVVIVVIILTRGKKKGLADGGDVVKAPSKSCPLELPEKELGTLVLPDSGNVFGFLRKGDTFKKTWTFDAYDISIGRRVGSIDLADMDEIRAASLSPDGKRLLVKEGPAFGNAPPTIRLWSLSDNKALTPQKWNPYPSANAAFDAPSLYRAEFVGNDRLATISTARFMDVFPLPTFDPPVVSGAVIDGPRSELLGKDDRFGQHEKDKYQRQVAFTADHKIMAAWNGSGYSLFNTQNGEKILDTQPLSGRELWPRESFPDRMSAGAVAFSPDGKILAGVLTHELGAKKHALCLWDANESRLLDNFEIRAGQMNDAPAIYWWGNRYVVTHGAKVEGMLIDIRTGLAKRQLMGPSYNKYGFGRDGRLWYAVSEERTKPATMYVVDAIEPEQLIEPDDYEQIMELREEFFLRRLWLESFGVMRKQTDFDASLRQQRLIRRP